MPSKNVAVKEKEDETKEAQLDAEAEEQVNE